MPGYPFLEVIGPSSSVLRNRVLTATKLQLLGRVRDLAIKASYSNTQSYRKSALAFPWGPDVKNPEEERLMSLIQQTQ